MLKYVAKCQNRRQEVEASPKLSPKGKGLKYLSLVVDLDEVSYYKSFPLEEDLGEALGDDLGEAGYIMQL